jgi:hypothetical protein
MSAIIFCARLQIVTALGCQTVLQRRCCTPSSVDAGKVRGDVIGQKHCARLDIEAPSTS